MKISNLNYIFIALAMLTSCRKDTIMRKTGAPPADPIDGIYVLNQGDFDIAPGSLTYYNIASKALVPDQYNAANGKQTNGGNDMAIYGSKMYIVGSGVDVTDPKTSKLIKHINFSGGHIAFYKGNAFVTGNDSTVAVIDTATLTITKSINIGNNSYPAGLAVANGKLYVAVPGLPDGTDNIVSVIDLSTLTVTKTIDVIHGPIGMAADANGHIIILSPFDDDDFASPFQFAGGLTVIDSQTDRVTFTSQAQPPINNYSNIPITVLGDVAYYFNAGNLLIAFNTKTYASTAFITDHTLFTSPSCLAVNSVTREVFVGDARNTLSNGLLYAFDKTGKLEYTITTGINPAKIVLVSH
jgi:YVTN family beta-propeller protein